MSRPAFSWAFAQGCAHNLAPADRLLLLCLADMMNGDNACWPGQPTLKHRTGLALRTIRAALPRLVAAGLIRVEERSGYATHYHLNVATNGVDPSPAPRQNVPDHPGNPSPTPPANHYRVPGKMSPGHPGNPSPGPSDVLHATPAKCLTEPLVREPSKKEREELSPTPLVPRGDVFDTPRAAGTNPRSEGTNPRAAGTSPRQIGENPRAIQANPRVSGGADVHHPSFDAFWAAYPRKVGRRTASAAFTAAVNRGNDPAAIVAGVIRHQFHHDPQFQPHPTTWLRADRWLDEVDDFDPVLRAAGLKPEDYDPTRPRLLQ